MQSSSAWSVIDWQAGATWQLMGTVMTFQSPFLTSCADRQKSKMPTLIPALWCWWMCLRTLQSVGSVIFSLSSVFPQRWMLGRWRTLEPFWRRRMPRSTQTTRSNCWRRSSGIHLHLPFQTEAESRAIMIVCTFIKTFKENTSAQRQHSSCYIDASDCTFTRSTEK